MPRGKNYVNNNRGVSLQATKKKNASSMQACLYGAACTRKDCIYRHDDQKSAKDSTSTSSSIRSTEPCMAFLAGICTFSASTCLKRHPSSQREQEELIARYSRIPCRYGESCMTKGCLYFHPSDTDQRQCVQIPDASFTYASSNTTIGATAWRPAPPTGPNTTRTLQASASAWKPAPPTGQLANRTAQSGNATLQPPTNNTPAPTLNVQAKEFKPTWAS